MSTKAPREPVTLESIREKNRLRQVKFYEKNKEALNEKKREKYALGTKALNAKNKKNGTATEIVTPTAPVVDATPAAQPRRSTRVVPQVTEAVVEAPPKRAKKVATEAVVVPETVTSTKNVSTKPKTVKRTVGNQGLFGYVDLSKLKSIDYDQAVAQMDKIIFDPENEGTFNKYADDLKTAMRIADITNLVTDLRNQTDVLAKIDGSDYAVNSKKGYLQVIIWCIDHFELKIPKDDYMRRFEAYKVISVEKTKANKTKPLKFTFMQYIEAVEKKWGKDSIMYVISKMYYDIPLRDDFGLVITDNLDDTLNENDNTNYLYNPIPKKSNNKSIIKPMSVILHSDKTGKRFGAITIPMSNKLTRLVRSYMTKEKRANGDFLFGRKTLTGIVSPKNKEIDVPGSITNFRNMKIKEFKDSGLWDNAEERAKLATMMRHSTATQSNYLHDPKTIAAFDN